MEPFASEFGSIVSVCGSGGAILYVPCVEINDRMGSCAPLTLGADHGCSEHPSNRVLAYLLAVCCL